MTNLDCIATEPGRMKGEPCIHNLHLKVHRALEARGSPPRGRIEGSRRGGANAAHALAQSVHHPRCQYEHHGVVGNLEGGLPHNHLLPFRDVDVGGNLCGIRFLCG